MTTSQGGGIVEMSTRVNKSAIPCDDELWPAVAETLMKRSWETSGSVVMPIALFVFVVGPVLVAFVGGYLVRRRVAAFFIAALVPVVTVLGIWAAMMQIDTLVNNAGRFGQGFSMLGVALAVPFFGFIGLLGARMRARMAKPGAASG